MEPYKEELLLAETYARILETRALVRGCCQIYDTGAIELRLEVHSAVGSDLVKVEYESLESALLSNNRQSFSITYPSDPQGFLLEPVLREWGVSRETAPWRHPREVILTLHRGSGYLHKDWPVVPADHFHFVRHYTALRALIYSQIDDAAHPSFKALVGTCYRRFDGFLREQLQSWNRFAETVA